MTRIRLVLMTVLGFGVLTALLSPSNAAARDPEWICFGIGTGTCELNWIHNCWCE
jgi:hypothetical protein